MMEVKTKLPHLALECLLRGEFPTEHKAQCQGALWVAEREWIDLVAYWPKLPLFVARAYRDEVSSGRSLRPCMPLMANSTIRSLRLRHSGPPVREPPPSGALDLLKLMDSEGATMARSLEL